MSLAIFPSEIGQGLSGQNRWGWKLPIKKTPSFKTLIQTPANNIGELRVSLTTFPIWMFDLDLAWMRGDFSPTQINSAMQQIVGFYGQMQGAAVDWLYLDPWDNGTVFTTTTTSTTLSNFTVNNIGVGDGLTTQFQFTRNVAGLVDLIQNFVTGYPLVFVGGVLQNTGQYAIDTFGNITFNVAPPLGQVVSWYGQFYFRCRFLEDELTDLQADVVQIWSIHSLKFKSLLR